MKARRFTFLATRSRPVRLLDESAEEASRAARLPAYPASTMTTLPSGWEASALRNTLTAETGTGVEAGASLAQGPMKSTVFSAVPLFGMAVPMGMEADP